MRQSETSFLRDMARKYRWDEPDDAIAAATPDQTVRRLMDLGVWDDLVTLEQVFGRRRLAVILKASSAGSMREKSWWFWHYRLGVTKAGDKPPAMPARAFA